MNRHTFSAAIIMQETETHRDRLRLAYFFSDAQAAPIGE